MEDNIKKLKDTEREVLELDLDENAKGDVEVFHGRDRHRHGRGGHHNGWIPGLVLIGIGTVFLLKNFTDFRLDNWWALFILIPAFGSLGNFVRAFRSAGRINGEARGSLIGGLILSFVAAIFLFGLDWGAVWPLFLIIGGLGALLSGIFG